ncbi:MAG: UTP--glucose-1-phosphate uridylyltransferase GalU [Coriobacteriia bacterium]|nr:UTP--glucose-1-phosphate uridylyltransferase GalU [Coriobacteriia bacterium]MCL2536876.1 UTP--glucose-1-phosphate uridylyltransferase GalU [Coriobacteriia bacterium]
MKAIIPVAGLGTRFLPVTKAQPKEMLPVVDKPIMQYVIEEAVDAGVDAILLVTGRSKKVIEDHFDRSVELEQILAKAGKDEQLSIVKHITDMAEIFYVRQKSPRGLGHAVGCGESFVSDHEPFFVLLGDVIVPNMDILPIMQQTYERYGASVIAVEKVAPELTQRYGVISGTEIEPGVYKLDGLVEKPAPGTEPSNLAVLGRYLLTPQIMELLQHTQPGAGGEIQLTDAMIKLLESEDIYAVEVPSSSSYDTGNVINWLEANLALAMQNDSYAGELRTIIARQLNDGQEG